MKFRLIIIVTVIAYILITVRMFYYVDEFVAEKDFRLHRDICQKLYSAFNGKSELVDVVYSNCKVGYKKVAIPPKPKRLISSLNPLAPEPNSLIDLKDLHQERINSWNDKYANLSKMYRLNFEEKDNSEIMGYEGGWKLVILENYDDGICQTTVFPYAVGYIKQDYYGESYLPSIADAVNDAFDFYTKNDKSKYFASFERGSYNRIWSAILTANNEYYYMEKDYSCGQLIGDGLFEDYLGASAYCQNGYMYNGYYKVFIATSQPTGWSIKKRELALDEDKSKLCISWFIAITLLFIVIFILESVIYFRHQKIKKESLYDRLKRMCNPKNFIKAKDYDKEKVDKANIIYKKLLETNPEDKGAVEELQMQAVNELGISLVDAKKLMELKKKVNPKKYLKPYNPDKLTLANELYAILSGDSLSYEDLKEVEERAKKL